MRSNFTQLESEGREQAVIGASPMTGRHLQSVCLPYGSHNCTITPSHFGSSCSFASSRLVRRLVRCPNVVHDGEQANKRHPSLFDGTLNVDRHPVQRITHVRSACDTTCSNQPVAVLSVSLSPLFLSPLQLNGPRNATSSICATFKQLTCSLFSSTSANQNSLVPFIFLFLVGSRFEFASDGRQWWRL